MKRAITEEEATLRYSKMIVAHLVTSVHNFEQFQDIAVELLAQLLIDIIKQLAEKVMQVLRLQKRNMPNTLHLLFVSEHFKILEKESIYEHILTSRERRQCLQKSQLLSQYGAILFSSMQKTNKSKRDANHPNINYIPPSCTFDFSKALPHKREIYRLFNAIQPKDNQCRLKAYSLLRPAVIEVGEEEDEVVEVYQKDRVRQMYAARNKISKKIVNSNTNAGIRHSESYLPSSRTAINLDSIENLPKSIIDLDNQISNSFTKNYIVIDSPL